MISVDFSVIMIDNAFGNVVVLNVNVAKILIAVIAIIT